MNENPLGYEKLGPLIRKFALPSIVGMLVTSIYNIVDQIFIGQAVGELGNAATNIAYPMVLINLAFILLFGIGGAANFNLCMGAGKKEKAAYYVGNAFVLELIGGAVILAVSEIFLQPILIGFGSPDNVLDYAMTYLRITAIGFPFVSIVVGGGHLIRADGSPTRAMAYNLSGAIINIFLDYLFTMVIKMGIAGAAYATVIGQVFSFVLTILYMRHYKTVKLEKKHFVIRKWALVRIILLGMSSFINQIAMMLVQIVSNNLLNAYGALSVYGSSIPIACAGIVMKLNQIVFSIVIGISQGCQPIFSFNYGAENYKRVKGAYKIALISGLLVSTVAFVIIQVFPRQIFSIFGNGSEQYFEYGVMYLKTFLMFIILATMQPVTNTFFSAIGKPKKGMVIAIVKQIAILLPAMIILTPIIGVNGVMYAGPIADVGAGILIIIMAVFEFKDINRLERLKQNG